MIYWWGWVLIVLCFFGFLLIGVFWLGIAVLIRVTHSNPTLQGIFIGEDGKFKREVLANTGLLSTDWKLDSTNKERIRFKIKLPGLTKKREEEWKKNDYIEFDNGNGKKLIIFGLSNINNKFAHYIEDKEKTLSRAMSRAVIAEGKFRDLENNFDKKVAQRLQEVKDSIPFMKVEKKK